jgi:hypothetical protein
MTLRRSHPFYSSERVTARSELNNHIAGLGMKNGNYPN